MVEVFVHALGAQADDDVECTGNTFARKRTFTSFRAEERAREHAYESA